MTEAPVPYIIPPREVVSSNLQTIAYDGTHLVVTFKNGASWQYRDVPANVIDELLHAESIGRYFAQHIKPGYHARDVTITDIERSQTNVLAWAVETFGEVAGNEIERGARLVEEAIEVAQAIGVPRELIDRVADRVYAGEPGELQQELGGVQITLQATAECVGADLENCADREWDRVQGIPSAEFRAKHRAKVVAGTTADSVA